MYLAATTWKANSSGSEAKYGSNGAMPGVDEIFKSRIMFDDIMSLKRNLNRMGMLLIKKYTYDERSNGRFARPHGAYHILSLFVVLNPGKNSATLTAVTEPSTYLCISSCISVTSHPMMYD